MNDSLFVGSGQALAQLSGEANDLLGRQWAAAEFLAQRLARDQFHGQEVHIILSAEFKNGGDIGVIQFSQRERFLAKLFARRFVGYRARGQHFQRNVTVKLLVFGAVDDAHAAGANLFDDPIMPERLID